MLESFNTKNEMEYQRLSAEEQRARGILGRLVGVIADFKNATRNGRHYTEALWDKTFNDPLTKEKLESRCIFGELGHPADRQEIDMEKICICLAEMPKKGTDGKLYGVFDILDTPNGRILKTMCDYGCNIGVSSRGGGDTFEDYNGNETVDSDTYEFECFDAVLLPAVKAARPKYVTESLNTKKTLHEALIETISNSSEDEKRVMEKTLEELGINTTTETPTEVVEEVNDNPPEKVDNIDDNADDLAAKDIRAELTAELQEAIKKQSELELTVETLQEKLSVCYTKESRYSAKLEKTLAQVSLYEGTINDLNETVKQLNETINQLKEDTAKKDVVIESLNGKLSHVKNTSVEVSKSLNEQVTTKNSELTKLNESLKALRKDYDSKLNEAYEAQRKMKKRNESLIEEVATLKKDSQIQRTQSAAKLEQSQKLTEKYKGVARTAVEKYVTLQATRLGVKSDDIKQRLGESYSFNDIDRVCEDLQQYKLTLNALPFSIQPTGNKVKAKIKESVDPIVKMNDASYNLDDEIDASLLTFTN